MARNVFINTQKVLYLLKFKRSLQNDVYYRIEMRKKLNNKINKTYS